MSLLLKSTCLYMFLIYTIRHVNTYRFMSEWEYQLGLVDIITEANPNDEITDFCYPKGKENMNNLTTQKKYRMCQEALTLERFETNNFTLRENGVPGDVRLYKCSFQISHIEGDMMHFISWGFKCPSEPAVVYLQQGPQQEIIYVNAIKTTATTPAYEPLRK